MNYQLIKEKAELEFKMQQKEEAVSDQEEKEKQVKFEEDLLEVKQSVKESNFDLSVSQMNLFSQTKIETKKTKNQNPFRKNEEPERLEDP